MVAMEDNGKYGYYIRSINDDGGEKLRTNKAVRFLSMNIILLTVLNFGMSSTTALLKDKETKMRESLKTMGLQ